MEVLECSQVFARAQARQGARTDLVAHNLVRNLAQPSSAQPSGAQARLKKRRRADFPTGSKTHTVRESLADSMTRLL